MDDGLYTQVFADRDYNKMVEALNKETSNLSSSFFVDIKYLTVPAPDGEIIFFAFLTTRIH